MSATLRPLLMLTLLLASAASWSCNRGGARRHAAYDGPSLVVPSTSPTPGPITASWTASLPADERPFSADMRVWAAVPTGARRVDVAVYRVVGQYSGVVSLLDRRGQRVDGVPPALVHAAAPLGRLRLGDVVLCDALAAPALLGRVTNLEGAIYVTHQWGYASRETAVDHAETPRQGIAPMAYASFPRVSGQGRGLILALSDGQAWLRDEAGEVIQAARDDLAPILTPTTTLQLGELVNAYSWSHGVQLGQVSAVLTPGLSYRVDYAAGGMGDFFFAQLESAPAGGRPEHSTGR